MEWSNTQVLKLIELYRKQECLWNPTHDEYKSKSKKLDAWNEISESLKCEPDEVKKKVDSLLTSFRRERQKEERKTGCGTEEDHKSTWFAFKSMLFLLEKFAVKKTIKTEILAELFNDSPSEAEQIKNTNTSEHEPDDTHAEETGKSTSVTDHKRKPLCQSSVQSTKRRQFSNSRAEEAYNKEEIGKSTRTADYKSTPLLSSKRRQLSNSKAEEASNKNTLEKQGLRDESEIYGEYIAAKHRKYNTRTRSVVEHLIGDIIYNADVGLYENNSHLHSSQQPPHASTSFPPTFFIPFFQACPPFANLPFPSSLYYNQLASRAPDNTAPVTNSPVTPLNLSQSKSIHAQETQTSDT